MINEKLFGFYLNIDLKKRLKVIAAREEVTISKLLNNFIRGYVTEKEKRYAEIDAKNLEISNQIKKSDEEADRPRTPEEREKNRQEIKQIRENVLARGDYWDPEPFGFTDDELDK